jgi:hypothetical protein
MLDDLQPDAVLGGLGLAGVALIGRGDGCEHLMEGRREVTPWTGSRRFAEGDSPREGNGLSWLGLVSG